LGIYAAIFSPVLFIYLVYALYRRGMKEERTLLWYLGSTALIFSLLFSFRQQMKLEELAPYILVATPILVKAFLSSYRIRLREFRKGYRILLSIGMGFLVASTIPIYMNMFFYLVIEKPSKNFVYNNHIAKELANELRAIGIDEIYTYDERLQLRLKFYGIHENHNKVLYKNKPFGKSKSVTIRYIGVEVARFYVSY